MSVSLTFLTFQDLFIQKFLKLPCIHFFILSNQIIVWLSYIRLKKTFQLLKTKPFLGGIVKLLCFTFAKAFTGGIISLAGKQTFVASNQLIGAQRYYLIRKLIENHSLFVITTASFQWRVLKNSKDCQHLSGLLLLFVVVVVLVLLLVVAASLVLLVVKIPKAE